MKYTSGVGERLKIYDIKKLKNIETISKLDGDRT